MHVGERARTGFKKATAVFVQTLIIIKPRIHTNPHELTLEPSCKFVKTSGQIFCDMEGKGVLFKRFADIDVFDIEIDTQDPEELIRTVMLLEPTFGGINLESGQHNGVLKPR